MVKSPSLQSSVSLQQSQIPSIVNLLIQSLIRENCTQVHFSYGDELCLDFGKLSPCHHPKLKHLLEGEWILCTRATPWKIYADDQLILDSKIPETDEEIKQAKQLTKQKLEGKILVNLEIDGENLITRLQFKDRYSLILYPDLEDLDLEYWELFMPTEQVLTIGPGYNWSCKSIHDRY